MKKKICFISIVLLLILTSGGLYFLNTKETNKEEFVKLTQKEYPKKTYTEDFKLVSGFTLYPARIITKKYSPFKNALMYLKLKKSPINDIYSETVASYENILLKEKVENKLKKIFKKNMLISLEFENLDYYDASKKEVSGEIYIFGKLENENDKEEYRKEIYDFIQYLKQEGLFEWTYLTIHIVDERMLTKKFFKNNLDKELLTNYENYHQKKYSLKEYRENKKEIYSKVGEKYKANRKLLTNLEKYSKSKEANLLFYGSLTFSNIYSEKVIKSERFLKNEKIKKYNKIEDVSMAGDLN